MTRADVAQGADQWQQVIFDNPDIAWRLVRDIVKVAQTSGKQRVGRRPLPAALSYDELMAVLFPDRFSVQPFPAALAELVAGERQADFAARMLTSQPHLHRLLAGKSKPTLRIMEAAAAAAGVAPGWFVEYRAERIADLLTRAFIEHPNQSIQALKTLARETRSQ